MGELIVEGALTRVLSFLTENERSLLIAHKDMVFNDHILRNELIRAQNGTQASLFVNTLFEDYEEIQDEIMRQRQHFDAWTVRRLGTMGAAMLHIRNSPAAQWNRELRDMVVAGDILKVLGTVVSVWGIVSIAATMRELLRMNGTDSSTGVWG
eukprot:m51a1_g8504 hypothetical protein (153) ;mRNA; f:64241-65126